MSLFERAHENSLKPITTGLFFQDGKDEKDKTPTNKRVSASRPQDLPKDQQVFLEVLTNRLENKITECKEHCVIPKEAHSEVPHLYGAIKSFGDNSISRGINNGYNLLNRLSESFKLFDKSKSTAINQIIKWGIAGMFTLMVAGLLYYKYKGG
jgi:hypothetical protein